MTFDATRNRSVFLDFIFGGVFFVNENNDEEKHAMHFDMHKKIASLTIFVHAVM